MLGAGTFLTEEVGRKVYSNHEDFSPHVQLITYYFIFWLNCRVLNDHHGVFYRFMFTIFLCIFFLWSEASYTVRSPGVFEDFINPKFAVKGKPFVLECIVQGRLAHVLAYNLH